MASKDPPDEQAEWLDEDIVAFELMIRGRLERDKGNLAGALALFNEALDVLRGSTSTATVTQTLR